MTSMDIRKIDLKTVACYIFTSIGLVTINSLPSLAGELKNKAVLELFTSQGCPYCPPADALLAQLAKRDDIVALTLPVDYWDYLGWKDTLAKQAYTKRQRDYARSRGDGEIFTPQMVVNGMMHVIGSRAEDIEDALERTDHKLRNLRVPVSLSSDGASIWLRVSAAPQGSNYRSGTLWVAFFSHAVPVDIRRGDNQGRRITYTNVVRDLKVAAHWEGEPVSLQIAIPHQKTIDGCAAFLQTDKSKVMLGVAISQLASR